MHVEAPTAPQGSESPVDVCLLGAPPRLLVATTITSRSRNPKNPTLTARPMRSARPVPVVGCVRSVLRVHDPCGTRFRAGRCGTDEAAILTGTPGLAPRRGDSPAPPQPVMMAPPLAHEGCTRSRNRAIRRAAGVAESADGQRLTRARVAPGLRPLAPARAAVAAGRLVDRMQAWPPVRVERSARRRTADTRCARARRTR